MTQTLDQRSPRAYGHRMNTMTTAEVAATLGVSVRTVHRMVDAEQLTPIAQAPGPRGAYIFARADVDGLLAA